MVQHYNATECCFKCRRCKRGGCVLNVFYFNLEAGWVDQTRCHAEFMDVEDKSKMTSLPSVHKDTIMLDAMHLIALGVFQPATGGELITLVRQYGQWASAGEGMTWKTQITKRLEGAHAESVDWLKQHNLVSSQPCFTVGRLGPTSLQSSPMC